MERAVLVPVDAGSIDANLHVADWYSANLKLPGDRLVFVSVLVPNLSLDDSDSSASEQLSIVSEHGLATPASGTSPIEATMERQLADSCRREEKLAARLKARGCCAFRYIHAFGRSRADTLTRIAREQRAALLLATYDAIITADNWDLSYALGLFKRARLALQLVPPPPQAHSALVAHNRFG